VLHSVIRKSGLAAAVASLALSSSLVTPAKAGEVEQEIVNNVIQNILQNVRDQIQRRKIAPPPGRFQFTGEESDFDGRNPFVTAKPGDPFAALAYAKAPAMVAAPVPIWIFGINGIGSGDRTSTVNTEVKSVTGTGAFDVTKIGIFTATDALTFVATGSGTWSHILGSLGAVTMNTSTGTGSGTLAYVNGGFSTDFTVAASLTHVDWVALGFAPQPDSSSVSYTGNVQYKYDLPYTFWVEPTIGVTYTEAYTANFGTKIGDATEVHAGGRVGFETKWMGFTVQPSMSGAVFKIVDQNGVGAGGAGAGVPGLPGGGVVALRDTGLGGRGSAKINVIWTQNFSSYLEGHGSGVAGTKGNSAIPGNFVATQSYGAMGGVRYTW
jgi:hypothetical protein